MREEYYFLKTKERGQNQFNFAEAVAVDWEINF
jgi:hypothetical protein